ncbi:ORF095 [Staphylococcus phage 47]|uniref:ORF106 n=2 Tax=Triavirus TaxID=1623273 RepID=Q4ZD03_9CAUD|nr:ORF106 [Staphylococcus phage 42E]AAX91182.1 ORF106 [Staphylococcus phage 42E]AAX91255.1 ORF095 [Staphylococcus phage 47]
MEAIYLTIQFGKGLGVTQVDLTLMAVVTMVSTLVCLQERTFMLLKAV